MRTFRWPATRRHAEKKGPAGAPAGPTLDQANVERTNTSGLAEVELLPVGFDLLVIVPVACFRFEIVDAETQLVHGSQLFTLEVGKRSVVLGTALAFHFEPSLL